MKCKRIRLSIILIALTLWLAACSSPPAEVKTEVTQIGTPGFFHLVKENDVWWFVNPAGEKFVSLGINHIEPPLICSRSNRDIFMKKYGADLLLPNGAPNTDGQAARRWLDDSMNLIREWGFNTLGVHNPIHQQTMPYVAKFRPLILDGWALYSKTYMDPFDPGTVAFVDDKAREWAAANKDDTLILGVSFSDTPRWHNSPGNLHGWIRFLVQLPADAPGKQKWVEYLKERHGSVPTAEAIYGIGATSWNDFLAQKTWPRPTSPQGALADVDGFLPVLADAWYGLLTAAVRKHDPNHLIFGDKFEGKIGMPEWLDPVIGKYFDLTYIQWYDYAENQLPRLEQMHRTTAKPILLGDSSFSSPNRNNPKPKGVHLPSQEMVGEAYYQYLQTIEAQPYILGWHHCGFIEGSPDLKRFHPFYAIQTGFLRPDGTPYVDTVRRVTEANRQAFAWHAQATAAGGSTRPSAFRSAENLNKELLASFNSVRMKTTKLTNGVLTQVDNNVYNAGRFTTAFSQAPKKNISWIVTDDGVVVVDTGLDRSAQQVRELIAQTTKKPVRYVIYTHHHGTQIGGTVYLRDENTKVIAHEDTVLELDLRKEMAPHIAKLNSVQFDFENPADNTRMSVVYPDITYADRYNFKLGDTAFELYHADAEAQDYTIVWLPKQKIVWVADLLSVSAPMIASPMKRVRDDVKWKMALEFIKALEPEILITSILPPIDNQMLIHQWIDSYIAYLDFVHRVVIQAVNDGTGVEELVAQTKLPPTLADNPFVQDHYGTLEFNLRGLHQMYTGWFDMNGTHLKPVMPRDKAAAFVADMGGADKVLARAQQLHAAKSFQLALEYLDLLLALDEKTRDAHLLKSEILTAMSELYDHPITRNMLRRLAQMEKEAAEK
ncbi:MAG TPA: alkyl sulfatase dimerization domain-containing protein [bacterium]|nr:alkyl sulfatase dimerization domain-containing protein [bacterium]